MTEHIDDTQLNTDLRYRFDYLSKFINFTQNDITMLNKFSLILLPRIPVIVDTIYRKLLSFDITKHYFLIRNDGFQGHLIKKSDDLTIDSCQMIFRKDMLSTYLKRVFTQQDWNETFIQYLSRVGKIHTNHAGSSSINVDYIHINILLGYLEHILVDTLYTAEDIDIKTKHDIIMAINKFFWIQNDFFAMHYLTFQDEPVVKKNKYCCF